MTITQPDQLRVRAARNGNLVVFGANGFAFATWMSRVPDVKDVLALTPGNLSILLLAVSAGSVFGLPLAGRIASRIGAGATARLGMGLALPGIVFASVAVQAQTTIFLVMPGLFLLGMGSGIWDVAQNLEGTIVERALDQAIMPWFHAAFSGGTVAAALVGAGMTWLQVPIPVHLAAAALACAAAGWWGPASSCPPSTTLPPVPLPPAGHGRPGWSRAPC